MEPYPGEEVVGKRACLVDIVAKSSDPTVSLCLRLSLHESSSRRHLIPPSPPDYQYYVDSRHNLQLTMKTTEDKINFSINTPMEDLIDCKFERRE